MRRHWSTIIFILIFLVGLSLLLYPTVSDYWNSFNQSKAVAAYAEVVADLDVERTAAMLSDARAYNAALAQSPGRWTLSETELAEYHRQLDVTGTGIMGYIEIRKINCTLPIFHGTDEAVLEIAVGHLEGSSLPVGGAGTHCVLSGHRGLPSAKLFTDIVKLVEGDTFTIRTLDETLTYEVDQIRVVEPTNRSDLQIEADQDYCTLVTCTPYGVNSHRLLVRGHRIENESAGSILVVSDASQIEPILVAPAIAAPMLLFLLVWLMVTTRRKKKQ